MELRTVDPRSLIDNPDNPRGKAAPDHADEQMRLSIAAVGILQPPVVREMPEGLTVRYGSRRLRAALALKLDAIEVLVLGTDERADDDQIRAVLENIVRKPMSAVDQWRAIERLVCERWTEEAISNVLVLPVRTIRKLRLLASILPAMLDRMHAGDMPGEGHLRTIAFATPEEQAAAWKRNKPKKGQPVSWWALAEALNRRTMKAADALFDADFAEAYGVTYTEDLFAPADEDSRTTADVDGFLAAQQAWVEAHLPENGVVLPSEQYGQPKLPPKAQRRYRDPEPGDSIGFHLDERTGKVEQVAFYVPAAPARGSTPSGDSGALLAKPRPDVTQKGTAMIGDMRTEALHAALEAEPIDDGRLIGLLVLALAGNNVQVRSGAPHDLRPCYQERPGIAGLLVEGGALTRDPEILRAAARRMLVQVLSCRENHSNSGRLACIAGDAIGADAHLPNMATEDFLPALSKAAIGDVARGLNVAVQPTGKATRRDVICKVGQGRWVYPRASFAAGAAAAEATAGSGTFVPGWGTMDTASDDEGDGASSPDAPDLDAGDEDARDGGVTDDGLLPAPPLRAPYPDSEAVRAAA